MTERLRTEDQLRAGLREWERVIRRVAAILATNGTR